MAFVPVCSACFSLHVRLNGVGMVYGKALLSSQCDAGTRAEALLYMYHRHHPVPSHLEIIYKWEKERGMGGGVANGKRCNRRTMKLERVGIKRSWEK